MTGASGLPRFTARGHRRDMRFCWLDSIKRLLEPIIFGC